MPTPITKNSLRRDLKAKRANIENKSALEVLLTERVIEWLETQGFSSVFSYLATEEEVSTCSLIQLLFENRDCTLNCPKILDRTTMVAVEFSSFDELEMGAHGILTARNNTPTSAPIDIALVPGLAFTKDGARLGYGAGYYDRWFELHPNTIKVGICFECQIIPSLPTEAHDISMDFVITEESVKNCRD